MPTPAEHLDVGISGLVAVATLASATGLASVRIGAPPPDVPLVTAAGTRTVAAMRGSVVVLHFWATWCHVCLDELPRFVRLQKTFGNDVAVVTLSNEPEDVAASYLRLWNIVLPLVQDTTGADFKAYSVSTLPVTIVVNRAGNVSYVSVGETSWHELDAAVTAALGPT